MKRKGPWIAAGILTAAALWAFFGCPIRAITGVPCPSCGLTRATLALISGDFSAALAYHPLVLLAWLLLLGVVVYLVIKKETRRRFQTPFMVLFIAGGLVFLGVYFWRMGL